MAWTSAGYGGSNANAMGAGGGFGVGTAFAGWDQAQKSYFGGGGAPAGGGGGSFGYSGGGGGGNNAAIQGVLDKQLALNAQAKAENQASWNEGKGLLYSARDSYNNSQPANGARALTNQFLANPEAINNRVQAQIQGRAAGQIDAQTAAQEQKSNAILAAGGQADASSLEAASENINRGATASKAQTATGLEITRANQRNQDFMNAMGQGRAQAAQDYGVQQGTATTFLENMPQYRPDDLSGYAAIAGRSGMAAGGGFGKPPAIGAGTSNLGGFGTQNFHHSAPQGGISSTFSSGGGPDAYANAGGGGPAGQGNYTLQGGMDVNREALAAQGDTGGNGLSAGYGGGGRYWGSGSTFNPSSYSTAPVAGYGYVNA